MISLTRERYAMAVKPKPKRDDPDQSRRFIEAAEQVGADDDEAVERTLKRIASDRKPPKEKQ